MISAKIFSEIQRKINSFYGKFLKRFRKRAIVTFENFSFAAKGVQVAINNCTHAQQRNSKE